MFLRKTEKIFTIEKIILSLIYFPLQPSEFESKIHKNS